jgi:hypothetical protein
VVDIMRAQMQIRIHAFVQHANDLNELSTHDPVIQKVNRLLHARRCLCFSDVTEVKTSDAGPESSAISGERPIRLIGHRLHPSKKQGRIPGLRFITPKSGAPSKDIVDIRSGRMRYE